MLVMEKEEVLSNQLLVRVLQECACDLLSRLALEMDETGPLLHDVDHAEDDVV